MKKIFTVVCLLVLCSSFAFAAEFGFRGAFTFSTAITGSTTTTNTYIYGGDVGLAFNFPLASFMSIQPEVAYQMNNGWHSKVAFLFISAESDLLFDSIEIPLLLKLTATTGKVKFSIFGGPKLSLLVGNIKILNTSGEELSNKTYDDYNWKTTVFGVTAGAELNFKVTGGRFALFFRYDTDFESISKNSNEVIKRVSLEPGAMFYLPLK